MPIVDYEFRVTSRFQCPTPASASPARKRDNQLPAAYDVKTPHVKLDCVMGTRGTFVERIDCNFYQGHVPDAPVLLGPAQLETYRRAEQVTGWSKQRLLAFGAAALVGAGLGLLATGAFLGGACLLHLAFPTTFAAVTLADWLIVIVGWAVTGAFLCLVNDWRDWADARVTFTNMRQMADCAVRLDANVRRDQEDRESEILVNFGRQSTNWLMQQAGLELEAARDRAKMRKPTENAA